MTRTCSNCNHARRCSLPEKYRKTKFCCYWWKRLRKAKVKQVAILFVDENSIYKILSLNCYDKKRDARTYYGSYPVVAHPPCQLWGNFAKINYARWGGEHNKPGNDGGLFRFALDSVKRCGGVLEHPAYSKAWNEHGLTRPTKNGWTENKERGGVCEVWQSAYGHKARKKTWLFYVGNNPPFELNWDKKDGTHQIGFHDQRGKSRNKPTLSKKESNATPIEFAKHLIQLAKFSTTNL